MGSIATIYQNPNAWKITPTEKYLKPEYSGEKLFHVVYGEWDDELSGTQPMEIHIRESIVNKILSGEYKIHPNSKHKRKLILQDEIGNIVPALPQGDGFVY